LNRRDFIAFSLACGVSPWSHGQTSPRFADMHTHMARLPGRLRAAMQSGGVLLIAEKVIPDLPLLPRERGARPAAVRGAQPGEMRFSFEGQWARAKALARSEDLVEVTNAEILDRVLREGRPAVALASEGADFLEGDLGFLDKMRADGLVHLQLVHYRISDVGDISTEHPLHGGLTAFGKDVVRACNRLGILVDVAHASSDGIAQALEISSRTVVYSHGFVSAEAPGPRSRIARAIHLPLAKRLAEKGGVVGIWPLGSMYSSRDAYADGIVRFVEQLGAKHVGIGSDMNGLPSTVLPSYQDVTELAGMLEKRGLKGDDLGAVMGENYIRVLRAALTV